THDPPRAPPAPLSLHDALPISLDGWPAEPHVGPHPHRRPCVRSRIPAGGHVVAPLDPRHEGSRRLGQQHLATAYVHEVEVTVERSEEHTSELQSRVDLVCRLLL